MGSEWREVALTDIYDISSGLSKSAKDFGSGYPFLAFKDVFYNTFVPEELTQLVQSSEKEQAACSIKRGDVFLTRTSETMNELGMSAVALKDYKNATFNGFTKRLRPKPNNDLHPEFVAYYLRSPKFRAEMVAFSTMSTRASLNNEMISRLKIAIPSFSEQKSIAWILKTLDEKIELNRQINSTLEAMAQALFKSWFVDFDPVIDNALAAGNPIPPELAARAERRQQHHARANTSADAKTTPYQPLPADIQQQFPDRFVFTEAMGWLPEGWEVMNLTNLIDTISRTYPLKSVEKVIFLNTGDIESGFFLHDNYSDVETLPGQAKKSIQNGDILFSEIRPKNKRYAYVNFDGSHHVVSTKLMVLRAKPGIDSKFIYFVITRDSCLGELQRIAELRSGTFPQITFDELSLIEIPIPENKEILSMFSKIILNSFYEKQFQIQSLNKRLSSIRDTLLPKLLSGQLRIPDAEAAVDKALAEA